MTIVGTLIGALVAAGAFFLVRWILEARRIASERGTATPGPRPLDLVIGFVTNFFDTLGIGSFATTTAAFRLFRIVPDELIPGTMIVGDTLSVLTQAVLFISVVEVDPLQMTVLILVSVADGWMGTGIVTSLSLRADRGGAFHGLRHARLDSRRRDRARPEARGLRARARDQLRARRASAAGD